MPLSANLFRLQSSVLTRAKRATKRNNVGGEASPQDEKSLRGKLPGDKKPVGNTGVGTSGEGGKALSPLCVVACNNLAVTRYTANIQKRLELCATHYYGLVDVVYFIETNA